MLKAQIVIMDLFFAVFLFIVLLVSFFVRWNVYQLRFSDALMRNEVELYTLQLADQLLKSPGVPENWEDFNSTPDLIGLSSKSIIISDKKLEAFKNLGYANIVNSTNVGLYNFYFLLVKDNVSIVEIGNYSSGQAVNLRRNVIYKDGVANVEISLWK